MGSVRTPGARISRTTRAAAQISPARKALSGVAFGLFKVALAFAFILAPLAAAAR